MRVKKGAWDLTEEANAAIARAERAEKLHVQAESKLTAAEVVIEKVRTECDKWGTGLIPASRILALPPSPGEKE